MELEGEVISHHEKGHSFKVKGHKTNSPCHAHYLTGLVQAQTGHLDINTRGNQSIINHTEAANLLW